MVTNAPLERPSSRLGFFGFLFGALMAIPVSVLVYYVAAQVKAKDPLTGSAIIYVLMFIAFTSLYYWIKVKNYRKRMAQYSEQQGDDLPDTEREDDD